MPGDDVHTLICTHMHHTRKGHFGLMPTACTQLLELRGALAHPFTLDSKQVDLSYKPAVFSPVWGNTSLNI